MAEIKDLSNTDASNTARFPESQAPSTVNNGARALEGMISRAAKDTFDGWIITGGTGSAYTATPNRSFTASATMYDGAEFSLQFSAASANSATLNVGTTDARLIFRQDGTTISASDILTGSRAVVKYNTSLSGWILMGEPVPAKKANNVINGSTGATDNALLRADGTGTRTLQNSVITVSDAGDITVANTGAGSHILRGTGGAGALILDRSDTHGDNVLVGGIEFRGRDSGAATQAYAFIDARCVLDDAGAETGALEIRIGNAGTATHRLFIRTGVYTPNATGGDKGADTINASAVYDDNTLLTCYVFDAALDGRVDITKWDNKVPNVDYERIKDDGTKERVFQERIHDPLRKFAARIGGAEDPLDLDKYINHWKTKRHLTSLPNEASFDPLKGLPTGAWIQRLIETVEIQAVHIAQIHERLKVLENR